MTTSSLSVTLEENTIKNIDSVRGLAKRSIVIEVILSQYFIKKNPEKNLSVTFQGLSENQSVKKGNSK